MDRPIEYQTTSAASVAGIAAPRPSATFNLPAADRAPAPGSIGPDGRGAPACTAKDEANSARAPYGARRSVSCAMSAPPGHVALAVARDSGNSRVTLATSER